MIIRHNKIMEYIGKNSLPIYLLQGIVIAFFRIILVKIINDTNGILSLFICTIMGTIIPILLYEISKKVWKFDFMFNPSKYIK